ncbi:MAG TPA: cell surface protein SprA, partial [Gemmatimonadaceae bacterium]|nr:cell surface protein SprA [Gemmatimonadaceae bacterium]
YVESFEGEGGTTVTLSDPAWYYASQPADGRLTSQIPGFVFDTAHAATMAWQNNGTYPDGSSALFTINQIDPLVNITGQGAQSFEQILWLTLYPLKIGGLRVPGSTPDKYEWQIPDAPTGRRWRSVRTSFGPTGTDLSRVEQLEFWSLVDTSAVERRKNPTVVMDFGDISENTLAFSPTKLCVGCALAQEKGVDSLFTGKQVAGLDTMNTERDPLSRGFNVGTDDNGLPGDRVPKLAIATGENFNADSVDFPTCKGGSFGPGQRLGDARANCTILNSRLDEEDLDLDGQLNLRQSQRNEENILRYVIDMSQDSTYNRKGNCIQNKPLCWVLFRVPFRVPTDSINNPTRRRMNALRITVVSGQGQEDTEFTQVPIVRLRLIGSPWLKRSEVAVQGIGGEAPGLGTSYVVAGVIGTQDSTATLVYDSPPGVTDAPDTKQTGLEATRVQINERSMRLTAGGLRKYDRAEAYYRFPEGQRNFMGYRTLRVWAKGRGNGWGQDGELNFFVKIGRDADNFYMYRTPVQEGRGKAAWTDVRVSFQKFFDLRAQLQNAFLQGGDRYGSCSAADRALIDRSVPAATTADTSRRYAACGDGYMVYTTDPNSTPPNLAAVQELATGMVRVDSAVGTKPILAATDSLELWVDDIRLTDVVDTPGYAGQFGVAVVAGDVMDLRASVTRKDPNFRQLAEQPSFVTDNGVDVSSAIHLERLLPQALGLALPFSVSHSSASSDPFFLSESDLRGGGIQGLRTPQRSATAYSLGVRRTTPLRNAWLGPVFNNLALNSSFATADSRSEFQTGKSNNFTLGLDYNLVAQSRARRLGLLDRAIMHLPAFLKDFEAVRSLRNTSLRWTPTQLRFTSNVARATDTRYSFTKPADSPTDTARAVRGLTNLWRNGSAVELRPFNAIALRWDIASLRDLRDYRDRLGDTATRTLDVAPVAQAERNRLLGMDVGLERERTMSTALNFVPVIASWIRPHVDIGTSYSMLRDPNTRTLLRANADSTGEYRLPRRLSNSQTFTAGAQVDFARGAGAYFKEKSRIGRLAGAVQPLDVTFNRSLLSAFDGVPFTPGLGYQFGLGSVSNFLSANGRPATSAGLSTQLAVNGALNLPLGASLQNRYQRTSTRNWARRFDNSQGVVDGDNVSFPNVSLRWNPPLGFLSRALTSFATNADYVQTKTSEFRPTNTATPAERSATRVRTYRLAPSAVWGLGISTAAGYALSLRDDQRPGSSNTGRTEDYNVDLGKAFAAPARFQLRTGSTIRTRLSYQASHTSTFVFSEGESSSSGASGNENRRVRLADNGRNALNFNGESDLADNVTGSLVFSRIITFDEQNNRRYSQTVFSAV